METKIDKRTREYKDSRQNTYSPPDAEITPGTVKVTETLERDIVDDNDLAGPAVATVLAKLGHILALVEEIHTGMIHPRMAPDTNKITQLEPPVKPIGDLTKCMRCGNDLPPTETPRVVKALCHPCVWRNS